MPAELAALARSVLCVGFAGDTEANAPLAELRAFAPGGIVLFARNVGPALAPLVAALRACGDLPPLIAIDQEGGRVARIGAERVTEIPAAMAVGAAGDVAAAEILGRLVGRDLARLGISVDFAPCADLACDPANTVIGNRSYGDVPARVAAFVNAAARGLAAGGVAPAIKHFPGHGGTAVDSHHALPHIAAAAATLRARDLVPFAAAIAHDAAPIVMSAHIVVEALDAASPATLSAPVLTDLLRAELGFGGVVVTDCLEMDAIAAETGVAAGAVRALAAGADLLLISHSLERAAAAAAAIVAAVESGVVPRARLEAAAARVGALRERYAVLAPFAGPLDETTPLRVAQAAVTVIRGDPRLRDGAPVTVLSFEGEIADGAAGTRAQTPSLSAALRARRWKSELLRIPLAPDPADIELLLAQLPSLGERNFVIVTRRTHLVPAQRAAVDRILAVVPDALVVSAREPDDAACFPHARRLACIYGDERISLEGCADVLSGRAVAAGTLPVTIGRHAAVR